MINQWKSQFVNWWLDCVARTRQNKKAVSTFFFLLRPHSPSLLSTFSSRLRRPATRWVACTWITSTTTAIDTMYASSGEQAAHKQRHSRERQIRTPIVHAAPRCGRRASCDPSCTQRAAGEPCSQLQLEYAEQSGVSIAAHAPLMTLASLSPALRLCRCRSEIDLVLASDMVSDVSPTQNQASAIERAGRAQQNAHASRTDSRVAQEYRSGPHK